MGPLAFAVAQSIIVGIMMLCYLAVPARIVGITSRAAVPARQARRDVRSAARSVRSSARRPTCSVGSGILMLGWHYLFWVGIVLIVIGAACRPA